MTGQGRTGRGTAGQRDAASGNKSVIFHLVYKQVVTLRWAIAYYGLRPACDISKQTRRPSVSAWAEPMKTVF